MILIWVSSLVVVIPDVLFTKYQVLVLRIIIKLKIKRKVPDGDPSGKPQCYKEQREDDVAETIYDAAMLLVQVLPKMNSITKKTNLFSMDI